MVKDFLKDIYRNNFIKRKERSFLKRLPGVNINSLLNADIKTDEVNFKHSGHLGDIIYAMPAMYALAKGKKINLYLELHQQSVYSKKMKHPTGKSKLTEKSVEYLTPLISIQPGFNKCVIYNNELIHYDLNIFLKYPFDYKMGSITHWYLQVFGITADLSTSWLTVEPNEEFQEIILINRTQRYKTPGITYSFLNQYPRVAFIGLKDEYNILKLEIPKLEFVYTNNCIEMAAAIAGSRFFVGNQSFSYSLAEALKVNRVLEVYPICPNVIPIGGNAYSTSYQFQFEKIVAELYNK